MGGGRVHYICWMMLTSLTRREVVDVMSLAVKGRVTFAVFSEVYVVAIVFLLFRGKGISNARVWRRVAADTDFWKRGAGAGLQS